MNHQVASFSFIVNVILTGFIIYLTFLILKFTAKPKLKIRFEDRKKEAEIIAGRKETLKFYVENQGHWYAAKPAARNIVFYVNFEPEPFELLELRYGTAKPRLRDTEVKDGKAGRKYLKAKGIHLFHEEPGEGFEVDVKIPAELKKRRYPIWIVAHSEDCGCGFQRLWLKVKESKG